MRTKNIDIIRHIKNYCLDIENTVNRFGNDREIKGMRNVFAHDYGAIDYDRVWDTVTEDIPILLEFCQNQFHE